MMHYDEEDAFHARDRKQFRKERKLAQDLDRSKFKKTDLVEERPLECKADLHRGRVVLITGEGSLVDYEGQKYLCSLKGLLKKERGESKNIIAVGDYVHFERTSSSQGAIVQVETRTSFLSRVDISGRKEQLIAVNVDFAVICVSIVEPSLKPSLVDRYLIAAEKGKMQPIIAINKTDLLENASEEEKQIYYDFLISYEALGIPILSLSVKTGVGLDSFRSLLQNKTAVFSGQSGVGKSSLLNGCFGFSLKVGELSQKTAKGSHTTTSAELVPLPGGGYCVDTPGIRSFGIWKLKKDEVIAHFQDIAVFSGNCKFPDCIHLAEPGCAVKRALEEGKLASIRYASYQVLLKEAVSGYEKTTWS